MLFTQQLYVSAYLQIHNHMATDQQTDGQKKCLDQSK